MKINILFDKHVLELIAPQLWYTSSTSAGQMLWGWIESEAIGNIFWEHVVNTLKLAQNLVGT